MADDVIADISSDDGEAQEQPAAAKGPVTPPSEETAHVNASGDGPTPILDAPGAEEEIDLDYAEDLPRAEEEEGEAETSPDNGNENENENEDGAASDSEDGEIKSDGEVSEDDTSKKKAPKKEREDGELEDGEITDSDDDAIVVNMKQKVGSGPTARFGGAPGVSRTISASSSSKPENSWAKGLREARELLRKSDQKKMDPDFEEKRKYGRLSGEQDWANDSDDEKIPSLLSIEVGAPRRKAARYKGYDLANGDYTHHVDRILEREEEEERIRRGLGPGHTSPPLTPRWSAGLLDRYGRPLDMKQLGPQCTYPDRGSQQKRPDGRRPSSPSRRARTGSNMTPVSSRSGSGSRSPSRNKSGRKRNGRSGSGSRTPTNDLTTYRIPKRKGRRSRSPSADRRSPWRDMDPNGPAMLRPRRAQYNQRNQAPPPPRREPNQPIDLQPTGAEDISDDELVREASLLWLFPIIVTLIFTFLIVFFWIIFGRHLPLYKPGPACQIPHRQLGLTSLTPPKTRVRSPAPKRIRKARTPSASPPPPPPPPPPPAPPRDDHRRREERFVRQPVQPKQRQKTKEELLEELRRVEERLQRKRRQAAM
ncbi:unnamed protein product, partial [Mesorhabditis spiculigera]